MVYGNKIINLLEYRDLSRKSNDGKTTQGGLIKQIKRMVNNVNTTKYTDDQITDFITGSFTNNGILDTYNHLGFVEWRIMIMQMIAHEIWERNRENEVRL